MENITTKINGKDESLSVAIETSALTVIRDELGLTGTKLVCGSGACGACTILVDGESRCSCVMPAVHLNGKEVQTVEGHGKSELHPIQKAFLAHDGLQCGYCTPGFINEGIAFYNAWRSKNGRERPSRNEVAAAMAGHLCRCAAYVGIYAAIQSACAGDFEESIQPDYIRVDGPAKVTGAAKYTTDIQLPGQLVGMIFRSPLPHADLISVDFSQAQALEGVKAVINLRKPGRIRYEGEPIAAVAAIDQATAAAALKLIQAEFNPLPFVSELTEAMQPDAPLVWDKDKNEVPVASEGPKMPGNWKGNVRKMSLSLSSAHKGKAKREIKNADPAALSNFAGKFNTPTQFHTTLEPHCAVADWQESGKLTVYVSTQAVYWIAHDIAKHYKLNHEDITVIADFVGGAFGSKLTLRTETLTAIDLSKAAKAPVSVIYNRAEEFTETGFRPPAEIQVAISSTPSGYEPAYSMTAHTGSGIAIGANTADTSGLAYTGIAKDLHDYDVVTNFGPGCAFRAPGGPAAAFALEQSIDQLADQLKINPLAFRRKWENNPGYIALFNWAQKHPLWQNRQATGTPEGRFRKGVGMAFAGWLHLYMPAAEVEVSAGPDGITVTNAVQDMGQGSKTVLAQAVADVFGISTREVKVVAGSSKLNVGPTSGGSRTATSLYPAAYEAAEKVRDRLLLLLTDGNSLANPFPDDGGIRHENGFLSWAEGIKSITAITETVKRGRNEENTALGLVPLPQGMSVGKNYSAGVYLIEVEVDTLLGKTRVTQVAGAMRVGKIHVPQGARSQCYGGVIQGIGHVLYEDRAICPTTGRVLTRGLEDYRIPGIGDVPEIEIDFIEEGFDFVKQKGIGLAELCTIPVAGAVANAVYNATGWRPMKAPILPEEVLAGMEP